MDSACRYIIHVTTKSYGMMCHHNTVAYRTLLSTSHSNGNPFVADPENPSGESMR
jgi:hypothetical protein